VQERVNKPKLKWGYFERFGENPSFRLFMGVGPVLGRLVRIAEKKHST
jgi:hypothetical protein